MSSGLPMLFLLDTALIAAAVALTFAVIALGARRPGRASVLSFGNDAKTAVGSEDDANEWDAWLPESKWTDVDGLRVRWAEAGRGPTIVLLHGIGASMHAWRFVIRPLATRFRVIAVDLPGFGESDAPKDWSLGLDAQAARARQILERLGIERCGLVGSSMGGAIALWMSQQEPTRFSRVATLAPAVDWTLVPPGARRLSLAAPALRRALGPQAMRVILQRVLERRSLVDDVSVKEYLRPYSERTETLRAFAAALDLLSDRRLPQGLAQPKAKILVLYGERDRMVPRGSIERYLKVAPTATLRTHPNGGHHIMEDEPRWTARALRDFFDG